MRIQFVVECSWVGAFPAVRPKVVIILVIMALAWMIHGTPVLQLLVGTV